MMNPMQVAKNRTARLVREAQTPTYSTSTKVVKPAEFVHTAVVEIDGPMGRYRVSMPEDEVSAYLDLAGRHDEGLSDLYHDARCKCGNPDFVL